ASRRGARARRAGARARAHRDGVSWRASGNVAASRPYNGRRATAPEENTMGFLDKLKGAVNAMTDGGANVTIEYPQAFVFPGDTIPVRITATSTGAEVKSGGIFVV